MLLSLAAACNIDAKKQAPINNKLAALTHQNTIIDNPMAYDSEDVEEVASFLNYQPAQSLRDHYYSHRRWFAAKWVAAPALTTATLAAVGTYCYYKPEAVSSHLSAVSRYAGSAYSAVAKTTKNAFGKVGSWMPTLQPAKNACTYVLSSIGLSSNNDDVQPQESHNPTQESHSPSKGSVSVLDDTFFDAQLAA